MNVAEQATFSAAVTGGGGAPSYQWSVTGDVVKDYTDYSRAPKAADNYLDGFSATNLAPADLQAPSLSFYWGPEATQVDPVNSGPVARTVQVSVTAGTSVCQDSKTYQVERNATDQTRTAEQWYALNHNSRVLNEHTQWHMDHMFNVAGYSGAQFFDFHHAYIATFNAFRKRFGYAPVGPSYDPSTPIPGAIPHDDVSFNNAPHGGVRATNTPNITTPAPFTSAGGAAHVKNGWPCDNVPNPQPSKLTEWPTLDALGCAVTSPFHNTVHVTIGGDMSDPQTAPFDPVFFRWHSYLDAIANSYRVNVSIKAIIETITAWPWWKWLPDPPPFWEISFDRPVSGLQAGDLVVNGSPALTLSGSGAGPYIFSGYQLPQVGGPTSSLQITFTPNAGVSSGQIPGGPTSGGPAPDAQVWNFQLVDPNGSVPGDPTLTAGQKMNLNLDPTRADSGHDGVADSLKLAHPCTANLGWVNIDAPMDMAGTIQPPLKDAAGNTLRQDFQNGTDPCAAQPSSSVPETSLPVVLVFVACVPIAFVLLRRRRPVLV